MNFVFMSACFSANHGAVTSVIALASSFNATLGSYSVGVLYSLYVVTAMLFAQTFVDWMTQKGALVSALGLYSIYVGSYLVAALAPETAWYAVLFGASVGGFGAGVLWTAQGAYFKANSRLYAAARGVTDEQAAGLFSSVFATFYLGFEVTLKIVGSLASTYGGSGDTGKYLIYAIYTVISVGAAMLMTMVRDMKFQQTPSAQDTKPGMFDKVSSALRLLILNPKCYLMVPTNVAFGFAAAFITAYIQGSVIAPVDSDLDDDDKISKDTEHHNSLVLLYSSLAIGVATFLAMPFHWLRDRCGTQPIMLIGAGAFVFVATLSLSTSDQGLRHILWLLYIVYGAGRCIWESTVKAVFADFFTEEESPAAFANIILQSGIASAVAFFVFPDLDPEVKGLLLLCTACLGFVCYFFADRIHHASKSRGQRPLLSEQDEDNVA